MAIGRILNIGSASGGKDGMTAMPINDVVIWQKCAGIYGTYKYTTLDEIVNDTACLGTLFNNISANSYLSRSEILFDSLIANETTLAIMGNNQLIRDTIATNEMLSAKIGTLAEALQLKVFKHRSALYNSSTDTYNESYLQYGFANGDIAKTSIPSWQVISGAMYDDSVNNTICSEKDPSQPICLYYTFAVPMIVKFVKFGTSNRSASYFTCTVKLQAKDSGDNWIDVSDSVTLTATKATYSVIKSYENITTYTEYRVLLSNQNAWYGNYGCVDCAELQWYGIRIGLKD